MVEERPSKKALKRNVYGRDNFEEKSFEQKLDKNFEEDSMFVSASKTLQCIKCEESDTLDFRNWNALDSEDFGIHWTLKVS